MVEHGAKNETKTERKTKQKRKKNGKKTPKQKRNKHGKTILFLTKIMDADRIITATQSFRIISNHAKSLGALFWCGLFLN